MNKKDNTDSHETVNNVTQINRVRKPFSGMITMARLKIRDIKYDSIKLYMMAMERNILKNREEEKK